MRIKQLVLFVFLSITLLAEDGEDEILKILNKASRYKTPKYPQYDIYDPFQKATPALKKAKEIKIKSAPPIPTLKAIINNSAYIDGKWRKLGDDINGYKVVKIYDDYVILKLDGRKIRLSVTGNGADKHIDISSDRSGGSK